MSDDSDSQLDGLHHGKAAKLVRRAETALALAELEFEEREGKGRPSVLEAIEERAAELAAGLSTEQAAAELEAVSDGVGDSAVLVLDALRRRRQPELARAPTRPERNTPESSKSARMRPNRPLIGPVVRVRSGDDHELVCSTALWARGKERT